MSLSANPWIRLLRLDRPIGILLLLWPTLWSLWLAAEGLPVSKCTDLCVWVCLDAFCGCIINDTLIERLMVILRGPKIDLYPWER